jgi:hypothetical protein
MIIVIVMIIEVNVTMKMTIYRTVIYTSRVIFMNIMMIIRKLSLITIPPGGTMITIRELIITARIGSHENNTACLLTNIYGSSLG